MFGCVLIIEFGPLTVAEPGTYIRGAKASYYRISFFDIRPT